MANSEEIQDIIDTATEKAIKMGLGNDALQKHIIPKKDITEKLKKRAALVHVITAIQDTFYSHGKLPYSFFITDETGCVVFVKGIENIIKNGMSLNIKNIGPNGIGFALANKTAAMISGGDNYQQHLKGSITYGKPMLHNGKILGVVGFEIPLHDNHGLYVDIMENIVNIVVNMANTILDTKKKIDNLNILNEYSKRAHRQEAVIAVDCQMIILQLNYKAEEIMQSSIDNFVNKPLNKIINQLQDHLNVSPHIKGEIFLLQRETSSINVIVNTIPVTSHIKEVIGWIIELNPVSEQEDPRKFTGYTFDKIIGNSDSFGRTIKLARIISNSTSSVLITGESGTGKELLAQAIHNASPNAKGQFVAINSSAIPRELFESELFGYVEGAFTGAKKGGMQGKLLQANKGTLFLDEIGDMPLELQPKLLRVIQEQQVVPVGGKQPIPLNVRFIAATNQNIERMVEENTFRADLYYRLNVVELRIPPLREREEDILPLVEHFIQKHNIKHDKNVKGIEQAVLNLFKNYHWPGNIREFENALEMGLLLADHDHILLEHLPDRLLNYNGIAVNHEFSANFDEHQKLTPWEQAEKEKIIIEINRNRGNIAKVAKKIGISRATMYRRIEAYDLMGHIVSNRRKD